MDEFAIAQEVLCDECEVTLDPFFLEWTQLV